ncbi:hypothetical protein H4Q26_012151 [Puccinia striiformis f. sp. tritici PST-130]|nr:hypothetical protein H4Q26_012151 [Puccinia striiformis f. sp. tritici PST-130]
MSEVLEAAVRWCCYKSRLVDSLVAFPNPHLLQVSSQLCFKPKAKPSTGHFHLLSGSIHESLVSNLLR